MTVDATRMTLPGRAVSVRSMLALVLLLLGLCGCAGMDTQEVAIHALEMPAWGDVFARHGVQGTMVVRHLRSGQEDQAWIYDPERAVLPYLPASTFKILNACIALETGVVESPETVIPWDGVVRPVAPWNRDLTVARAFTLSAVPVFQELARRIGPERMDRYVRAAAYGNADISGAPVDDFWLEGNLRITAVQQLDFLARLYRGELPFTSRTMDQVKEMMVVERRPDMLLRAKSGWAGAHRPQLGWWVGWVERGQEAWLFALNLDIDKPDDAKARQAVALEILHGLGAL